MSMTSDAKRRLSTTIRGLRARLLEDLQAANQSAYRLSVRFQDAGLDEAARTKRTRLESWISEQLRAEAEGEEKQRTRDDFRRQVEKQAAYTLLNRLVILRLMEAAGLRSSQVVTGGWESGAYKDFRHLAPDLVRDDETEGYAFLLQLVFEDLATDLPGLYGSNGMADLVPVPAATLRHVVEALDDPALESCWTDDMTLGWIYQYWNDPEREELDAKLNSGGKIEPHEIAGKTQMFTERYMVDWLLQNSLHPMWLAMCKKHGWTPEVEADGTLDRLESRRVEWRAKRDSGEVSLTELMPLHSEAERRWAYYVPRPIPDDAVKHACESVRDLKILDPAVGSGHFLVVAFDLLAALYREEARHRGEEGKPQWTEKAIVERILEHNLHGIDLDPRAVQIAAAALWLKAQQTCLEAHPRQLNLVASNLRLSSLPADDPARRELREKVERETGIPEELTQRLLDALEGADHLGSLLKIDAALEEALADCEELFGSPEHRQGDLYSEGWKLRKSSIDVEKAKSTLLSRLEHFLHVHSHGDDLGLRLKGEQLAAGVRFVRMVKKDTYDLVVANPPYQGTSKMADSKYIEKQYPLGKADLYAAFLLRGLQLVRSGGVSAMLTMRSWMFIKQFGALRERLLEQFDLRAIGDVSWGAFEEMRDNPVAMSILARTAPSSSGVALAPTDPQERVRTREELEKKRSGILCHVGRHEFDPAALKVVPEWPLVYWWSPQQLVEYDSLPKIGDYSPGRKGLCTGADVRFIRRPWEVSLSDLWIRRFPKGRPTEPDRSRIWVPAINGGKGLKWFEPLRDVVRWKDSGLEFQAFTYVSSGIAIRNSSYYFRLGIAFSMIGNECEARAHRYSSVFLDKGSSLFPTDIPTLLAVLNRKKAKLILSSLNPSISFQVGDINRLPIETVENSGEVFSVVERGFSQHEFHREASPEFKSPGPSPWCYAQDWAQRAVDRPEGDLLPLYEPEFDPEPPTDHLSFALGVALSRFGANGEGILDPRKDDLSHALPSGILFLDGALEVNDHRDDLGSDSAQPLIDSWSEYGPRIEPDGKLRDYLRKKFFEDTHRKMYESRPIHWPLSSVNKTFVAWVTIHRWNESTLRVLLADRLSDALRRLDGELDDLRKARQNTDKKVARDAERRFAKVQNWRKELADFISAIEQCADKGPPTTDAECTTREMDARYIPDLDDGVMINSAALWPLLEPQWKAPKKWWKELATAQGKKDYDWSHLAMRYWPTRVDKKCRQDPSLGVAHGCFWKYHPARAWAWELRLQDEIGAEFRIEEEPYRSDGGHEAHRVAYLREHAEEALQAVEKEVLRRRRKQKAPQANLNLLESGLWSAVPELCWDLELRISKKQKEDFRLLAPDEVQARVAFEAAHPAKVKARAELLARVVPAGRLFPDMVKERPESHEVDA